MSHQVSLRKNERKKYQKLAVGIVLAYVLIFSTRFIFKVKDTTENTPIGHRIAVENRSCQLVSREYYTKDHTLVFSYLSPVTSDNALDVVHFSAKQTRNDKTHYRIKIQPITAEYSIVFISHIPEEWTQLNVSIYTKKETMDAITNNEKFYFARPKIQEKTHLPKHVKATDYEQEAIQFQLKAIEKTIHKKSAKQKINDQKREKLTQVNERLAESLDAKTEDEKEEIEQTMTENKSKQQQFQAANDTLQASIKEYQNRRDKLEKRLNEIKEK